MKSKNVYCVLALLAVAASSLAGCAKHDPVSEVSLRANERWKLLIDHEAVKAYAYLSPGYRETHSLDQYVAFVAMARLQWKAAKIIKAECEPEVCTVRLAIDSTLPGHVTGLSKDIAQGSSVSEHWISSGGSWYFVPEEIVTPRIPTTVPGQPPPAAPGTNSSGSPT